MAVSHNQRLRKAAAKAVKRKAVVAAKLGAERRELAISKPRHVDLAASPLALCTITADVEARGLGTLFVARKLTLGRYGAAFFLLDLWCLGIKDAFFRVLDGEEFEDYRSQSDAAAPSVDFPPADARKLVRDALAYGTANGFPPHEGMLEAERILADFPPSERSFAFGVEGKPYFLIGPEDPPAYVQRILDTLEHKFGADGFQYEYPVEDGQDAGPQ